MIEEVLRIFRSPFCMRGSTGLVGLRLAAVDGRHWPRERLA